MGRAAAICRRIDAALERCAEQRLAVRAIYLDGLDLEALGEALSGEVGHYAGHQVRVGGKSVIYSTHGVGVGIPARAR
jgi:hypothetical protein